MYQASNPGPYEVASLSTEYRAIKLQSDAAAVDLTVDSGAATGIPLHLEPGELHTGTTTITAGTITGVIGYTVQPNGGY